MPHSTKRDPNRVLRHANGHWYKKYKNQHHYFYKQADDPKGSYSTELWRHNKSYIDQGLVPPAYDPLNGIASDSATVGDAFNHFLESKQTRVDIGRLEQKTWDEYQKTCKFAADALGKNRPVDHLVASDFNKLMSAIASRYGLNTQTKMVGQVRSAFRIAFEDRVIKSLPVYGQNFEPPPAKEKRAHRNSKGNQTFEPAEIHALLKVANVNLKAMVLLGINCGFGNEDCAALPRSAINGNWIEWARVKTATTRRCPLWPETLEAIHEAIQHADSKGETELCFMGARGKNFVSKKKDGTRVGKVFDHAREKSGIRTERTFYDLRRTFQTVALNATGNDNVTKSIMGHIPSESNMSARYTQEVWENQLQMVSNAVRKWVGFDDE